jgi:hypothetical protein
MTPIALFWFSTFFARLVMRQVTMLGKNFILRVDAWKGICFSYIRILEHKELKNPTLSE